MQLITTADGSHSLFSSQYNEIYHSRNGAIQESTHVFIKAGLDYAAPGIAGDTIKIFEVGFGTGLNALLTFMEAQKKGFKINYETIERYPVQPELVTQLNYPRLLNHVHLQQTFDAIHKCNWGTQNEIAPGFTLKKNEASLLEFELAQQAYHLIYFDAFAPEKQPEMWTEEVMRKLYNSLLPGGVLVCYCSKGMFRRALKSAGFTVYKIPGPPGKREMVRALCSTGRGSALL
jgi:tRNA U34 5-methylaminomethyl-2-thiouridine-forming methyltransferase MnmC